MGSKALRIDPGLHQRLLVVSCETGITMKRIVEDAVRDRLKKMQGRDRR